jgi:catechol 2,3-dioxygenase-like lactoylglutathione lyase family enzyme
VAITLNHTIVPATDHEASARFFAEVMGLRYEGPHRHFAPVRVNETFTLDFCHAKDFRGHHLAFHVGEDDFDGILVRLRAMGVRYGNDPRDPANGRTDHLFGGRGLYFADPNGHLFEVMTKVQAPAGTKKEAGGVAPSVP